MNQDIKRAGILSLFYVSAVAAFGQTSFTMTKDKGNYYINTVVNGHDSVRIFVESGIPKRTECLPPSGGSGAFLVGIGTVSHCHSAAFVLL